MSKIENFLTEIFGWLFFMFMVILFGLIFFLFIVLFPLWFIIYGIYEFIRWIINKVRKQDSSTSKSIDINTIDIEYTEVSNE